jgi:acetamidase/formamidase
MIDFLMQERHLTRDAYMLASVAADPEITEVVAGNNGRAYSNSQGNFCYEAMNERDKPFRDLVFLRFI